MIKELKLLHNLGPTTSSLYPLLCFLLNLVTVQSCRHSTRHIIYFFSQEKAMQFEIKSKTSLKLIDVCVLNIISCYVNNTISTKAKAKTESILNYFGLDYSLWLITDFLIYWNFINIKVELMRDSLYRNPFQVSFIW